MEQVGMVISHSFPLDAGDTRPKWPMPGVLGLPCSELAWPPPTHGLLGPLSQAVSVPIGRSVLGIPKGQPVGVAISWTPP